MATHGAQENSEEPQPAGEEQSRPSAEESTAKESKNVTVSQQELEQLKKEANEFKDKYLRSIAEAENLRKRLHKERHDMTQLALQGIMVDFLAPIDHLENALAFTGTMADEVKNWAIGFKMILNQFKDVLASNDVHPFKSIGTPFDPHNHEAVEMIETVEYPAGTVIAESMRGYKMGSKTIRPARVKVAKAPAPANQSQNQQAENSNRDPNEKQPDSESNNQ